MNAPATTPDHVLSRRIADVLRIELDSAAIEYGGNWCTWRQLSDCAERIRETVGRIAPGRAPRVGILLRNRPVHVAALLGVLLGGGCVVVVNPSRGDDRTRADLRALALPVVLGEADDLATFVAPDVTTVSVTDLTEAPVVHPATGTVPAPATQSGSGRVDSPESDPKVAVLMLTSGTTGPPKRVALTYDMLARSVLGPEPGRCPEKLSSGVGIVNAPLVHIGGVFRVLQCIVAARPFVLLPRFEIRAWADAVRRYRPRAVSLVPAAVRSILHSDLTREDLDGITVVTSGTAPLSADDADAFTERFGIPVLTSYAATEFGGGVAGWTLPDHRRHWATKRGSVGRAQPGSRLRVVDEGGNELPTGEVGLLEVKPGQLGADADWIHTTDLARLDGDGFLWIVGRADQAVIRGGFKVLPEDVRAALESHPDVLGAAVIGRRDDRLGEVPVAMVELSAGGTADATALTTYLSARLARYEIPTEIAVVPALPRTPSGKADLAAVRAHFDSLADHDPGVGDVR
ncbi:class I adenylate-forming enzyme family protein [Rhodococcus sp. NPDC003322]